MPSPRLYKGRQPPAGGVANSQVKVLGVIRAVSTRPHNSQLVSIPVRLFPYGFPQNTRNLFTRVTKHTSIPSTPQRPTHPSLSTARHMDVWCALCDMGCSTDTVPVSPLPPAPEVYQQDADSAALEQFMKDINTTVVKPKRPHDSAHGKPPHSRGTIGSFAPHPSTGARARSHTGTSAVPRRGTSPIRCSMRRALTAYSPSAVPVLSNSAVYADGIGTEVHAPTTSSLPRRATSAAAGTMAHRHARPASRGSQRGSGKQGADCKAEDECVWHPHLHSGDSSDTTVSQPSPSHPTPVVSRVVADVSGQLQPQQHVQHELHCASFDGYHDHDRSRPKTCTARLPGFRCRPITRYSRWTPPHT